jgi:hypothetical protein
MDAPRDAQWKEEVRKRQQRHLPELKDEKHQKLFFFTSYTPSPELAGERQHQTRRHRRHRPQAPAAATEEVATSAQRRPQPQEPQRIDARGRSSSAEVMAVSTTPRPWAFKDESLDEHQAKALARYTRRLHSGRPGRIA